VAIGVPTFMPVVANWAVVDWVEKTLRSAPAAGGLATITLDQLPTTDMWLLDHMVAQCTSATATQMRLYADTVSAGYLRDGSDTGNFDVADWPAGLLVRPSVSMVAQWTGASDGAIATLTLQARIMRQVSS
jgi:hypothetical protein